MPVAPEKNLFLISSILPKVASFKAFRFIMMVLKRFILESLSVFSFSADICNFSCKKELSISRFLTLGSEQILRQTKDLPCSRCQSQQLVAILLPP